MALHLAGAAQAPHPAPAPRSSFSTPPDMRCTPRRYICFTHRITRSTPRSGAAPRATTAQAGIDSHTPRRTAPFPLLRAAAAAGLAALVLHGAGPAEAVLVSPIARVPRSAEAALRRSVPAFNPDARAIREGLESVAFKLRIPQRKPWASMAEDVAAGAGLAADEGRALAGTPSPALSQARRALGEVRAGLATLAAAVDAHDIDRSSQRVAAALAAVGRLELLQAPGLAFRVPGQYEGLPRLTGRAVVRLEVQRRGGGADAPSPDPDMLELTLDGFSAPLSAGALAAAVADGALDGQPLAASPVAVVVGAQTPDDPGVPLEILPAGDFEPVYRTPLDVAAGELPVLPLSVYGAIAMTQLPAESEQTPGMVSSRQFFIYKFDRSSAGLAGLSFDEGQFGVLGYVTKGLGVLDSLGEGDKVVSARIISGSDLLQRPQ
ncbi:CYN37 [Auxenochlorella protothecoides x Auxenochlorella symbiontica]